MLEMNDNNFNNSLFLPITCQDSHYSIINQANMKKIIAFLLLLMAINVISNAQRRTFLRIYGISGEKIYKGYFAGTKDSSLLIINGQDSLAIAYSSIGYIKTKRSLGHNMAICGVIGAVPLSIIGALSGETETNDDDIVGPIHDILTYTPAEGAGTGFLIGSVAGVAAGAIITAVRKSSTLNINGDINNWNMQRKILDQFPTGK